MNKLNHDAHCYLWSEVDGRRGSNEIGSCLLQYTQYLQSLPNSVQEISMFSDTCGGQNRNQNVTAVLYYAVQTIHNQKSDILVYIFCVILVC